MKPGLGAALGELARTEHHLLDGSQHMTHEPPKWQQHEDGGSQSGKPEMAAYMLHVGQVFGVSAAKPQGIFVFQNLTADEKLLMPFRVLNRHEPGLGWSQLSRRTFGPVISCDSCRYLLENRFALRIGDADGLAFLMFSSSKNLRELFEAIAVVEHGVLTQIIQHHRTGDAAEVLSHGPGGHRDAQGGAAGHEHCQQQSQPPGGRHALREQL